MAINYQGGDTALWGNAVNNTLSTLQKFGQQQIAKQQKESESRQKDVVGAMKEISKIDSNGIRQIDLDDFYKSYSSLKDTYFKMGRADEKGRLDLNFKLNQEITNINRLVERSKELKGYENEGLTLLADTKYNKGKVTSELDLIKGMKANNSWDLNYNKYSNALKGFSDTKVDQTLNRLDTNALKNFSFVDVTASKTPDGQRELEIVKARPDALVKAYTQEYNRDENFRNYVDSFGGNPVDVITDIVTERGAQGFHEKFDTSKVSKPSITNVNVYGNAPANAERAITPNTQVGLYKGKNHLGLSNKVTASHKMSLFDAETGAESPSEVGEYTVTGLFKQPVYKKSGKPIPDYDLKRYKPEDVVEKNFISMQKNDGGYIDNYITEATPSNSGWLNLSKDERNFYNFNSEQNSGSKENNTKKSVSSQPKKKEKLTW